VVGAGWTVMIIYLNWIGGWHRLLVGALAAAAGAFGLNFDVSRLRVRASSSLLVLALTEHTWILFLLMFLMLLGHAAKMAFDADVGHWVVRGRRFIRYQ